VNTREPGTPPRVLVVEDNIPVSMLIETVLGDMGFTVVRPATHLTDTLEAAGSEALDAAILDVKPNRKNAWQVALILRDRGIPFVFTTACGGEVAMPARLETAPIMSKPFRVGDLEAWLRSVVPRTA
jgi:DNA-binding response OmpR family regulator